MAVTLITASLEESGLETLRHYGEVRYQPMVETHSMLGGSRLVKALADVDIFITEADNLRQRELDALDHLQVICSCRGNPVNIDVAAATRKGIPVVHAPARNSEGVADLALLLMLMLSRRIPQVTGLMRDRTRGADMSAMAKVYFELRGQELWNKVVGVVGLGAIGRKVAERVRACGAKVISYDPYVASEVMAQHGAEKVDLETLMKTADYVTLHVMPNESNRGLISAQHIALMKPTAFFINTARSAITDESALVEALKARRIAGAGLDVYDKEPLPVDHPLMDLDNVILLPHIGGATQEVTTHQTEIIVPDVVRLIQGERPRNCMNPEVLEHFQFRR